MNAKMPKSRIVVEIAGGFVDDTNGTHARAQAERANT